MKTNFKYQLADRWIEENLGTDQLTKALELFGDEDIGTIIYYLYEKKFCFSMIELHTFMSATTAKNKYNMFRCFIFGIIHTI